MTRGMWLLHKRPSTFIGPQGFEPGLGDPFPSCPQECNEAALVWWELGGAWNPGLLEQLENHKFGGGTRGRKVP